MVVRSFWQEIVSVLSYVRNKKNYSAHFSKLVVARRMGCYLE